MDDIQPMFQPHEFDVTGGLIHRHSFAVIPAEAGIQNIDWTPAFAGVTDRIFPQEAV